MRARLEKNPSDWVFGACEFWGGVVCAAGDTDATCVTGSDEEAGVSDATNGWSGEVTGPRGGLTVGGMVPGAVSKASSDRP